MKENILVIMSPGGEFSSYVKKGDLERPLRFISNYSENYERVFYASSDSKSFSKLINKKLKKKNVFHITNFGISSKNKFLRYITYAFLLPFRIRKNVDNLSVIRCYDIYSGIPAIISRKIMRKNINIILSWQYRWSRFKQYNYNVSHKNRINKLIFKILTNYIESFVLKRCDYVFVTADFLKKSAINIGVEEKRIFILPNGLDFNIYPNMKENERILFRKRLGFSKDDKIFVFVGQIIERKGFPFLIDVFNQLGKDLMIIGDGPLLDNMKTIANKNIKFMGAIKNKDLYKYLSLSYAFVFPTEMEGHPNVILEAWKMGLPVITTETEGMGLVRDGYTGLVVKKNKNDFINSIKHISSSDKTYKEIKNNCIKEIKKYDWEKISKYEIEILKKIGV